MELKLTNYSVFLKEKITWKDIIKTDRLLASESESWDFLLLFIDEFIIKVRREEKDIIDKKEIEEIIFNPETTTEDDYRKVISETIDCIKKKVS